MRLKNCFSAEWPEAVLAKHGPFSSTGLLLGRYSCGFAPQITTLCQADLALSFTIVRPRSAMPSGKWVFNEELSGVVTRSLAQVRPQCSGLYGATK